MSQTPLDGEVREAPTRERTGCAGVQWLSGSKETHAVWLEGWGGAGRADPGWPH